MASKVLNAFLIGIGYDTRGLDAGDKKIQASLQGIKSSALGVGAIIGAFGAGAGVIVSTANKIDRLAAATQNMRAAMATSYNFGNAVKLMGGQAQEGYDFLKRAEEFQNNMNIDGQDGSLDALAKAGINVKSLAETAKAGDAMDVVRDLERQIQGLNEGQRAKVQGAWGYSDGVSRVLNEGKIESRMAQAASDTGPIDQMTANARKLAESTAALSLKFEGITNELSEKFMKSLIGASEGLNNFLKEYRSDISKGINYAAENPAAAALAVSGGAVIGGGLLSYLGLNGLGKFATRTGMPGLIGSGSYMVTDSIFDKLEESEGYRKVSDSIDQTARDFGLGRLVDISNWAFNKDAQPKISSSPSVSTSSAQQHGKEIPSPSIDDLVRAQMAARLNMDRDAPEGALSGVVDRRPPGVIYGDRSAADSMPPQASADDSYKDVQSQNSDDLVRAIQRAKVNVNNNLTIQLDGRELDARIIQVNERQNYEAMGDFKPTTER